MRLKTPRSAIILLSLSVASSAALACPSGSETLISCTLEAGRKQLQTCLSEDQVTYSFGRTGRAPDLRLSRPVTEVDLLPWPGVSRTIWEQVSFENAGVLYHVYYAQERDPRVPDVTGGLSVERNAQILADLTCDPGSVMTAGYPLPLFDAKVAAGQLYNRSTQSWN